MKTNYSNETSRPPLNEITLNGTRQSQSENILKYLKAGNTITPLEALNLFNCFRLGARCWDLRKQGHCITTKLIRTDSGKTVAQYRLNVPGKQIELF